MSAAAMDAKRISGAALNAAEKEFGGGLVIGARRFAVVVIVHQVGEETAGLGISVASNLRDSRGLNATAIKHVILEGLRVVDGQSRADG